MRILQHTSASLMFTLHSSSNGNIREFGKSQLGKIYSHRNSINYSMKLPMNSHSTMKWSRYNPYDSVLFLTNTQQELTLAILPFLDLISVFKTM